MFDVILEREVEEEEKEEVKVHKKRTHKAKYDDDDTEIKACNGSKFQIFDLDKDMTIRDFVNDMGLVFKIGRGFYEFTKPENISDKKEIVTMKKSTGELYEGGCALKLSKIEVNKRNRPTDIPEYRIFIQSTSVGRKLKAGTKFLYEVDGFGDA